MQCNALMLCLKCRSQNLLACTFELNRKEQLKFIRIRLDLDVVQCGDPSVPRIVYLSSVTLAECKQMTNDASAHMRTAYAAQRSESEDDIPVSWLCNSFGWKATPWVGEDVGQCSPMMFSTTSSESSGQFDYAWDTWVTTLHNIKI